MERLTDEELVACCRKGQKQAFEILVKRYEKQIFSLAFRLGGDYDEARDLAQESFLRIYQELPRYDEKRKFFPWMYRVAHNTCLNTLNRRPKNRVFFEDVGEPPAALQDSADSPEVSYERQETAELVRQALQQMPDQFRIPLMLKYMEGLSYQEISQRMDLPVSTIETRLHRGRKLLQKRLQPVLHK